MATTTPPASALNAYLEAQMHARALLVQIQAYLDGHHDCTTPADVHWGHVGDIQGLVAQLTDIGLP